MTEREKIIEIIESNKLCVLDMDCNDCPYKDKLNKTYSCGSYKLADTLIEAGIGDKSRHRLFISKDGTVCKQLYSCEEVEQIAKERDEYKHRAEVAERALKNALNNDTCYFCNEKISCRCEHRDWGSDECIKSLLRQAEKELAEEQR